MAAVPLKITDNGNGILVQGTNNVFFPDNATLTFPYNSIILIVDESDMVTFRSAANNDVLFSGQIGKIDIGEEIVTKANIIEKFDAVANQATGGGDIDYSGLFAGVSYDSQTKHINFYDKDDTLVTYVDATAFIKDGMVDTVVISNGNLVITFNTDAGKQPITIPLTDIFNPSNYYDKTATDTLLAAKADSSSLATVATSGSYNDLSNKPTIPAAQVNADWNASSGVAQILNKPTNVSSFTNDAGYLTQHQSLDNYYTKTQVDTALNAKQDTLTAGTGIDITNNVISATGGTQVQSDWNQSDSSAVDYIKNKPTIPDTSDFVTKAEYNPKEVAIANALTQLNDNKADKTELPDTSTFATKTELNAKQDTLTAGTGISIQNNVISATGGGGTQVQSDWNQSDSSAVDYIKNKPTIPAAQVNADWNASSGVAQILNKPTIPTVPTTVSSFTNDAHYVPSSDNTIQNIVKKEQSEYDTLVNNSQVDPNTLYIIVPDSI